MKTNYRSLKQKRDAAWLINLDLLSQAFAAPAGSAQREVLRAQRAMLCREISAIESEMSALVDA